MIELRIGDQTIRHDRNATAAVYASLDHGFAEKCGCLFCRNFALQRNLVYPASFRALLEQLGIDPNKEGEAFEYGPVEDAADSNYFESFFTTAHPGDRAFCGGPMLAIEFTTQFKLVLPDDPR
jgi:hypothetical protein